MGLLNRLSGSVLPQKKAGDDLLLFHAILLMAFADGSMGDDEEQMIFAFAETIPEFSEKDPGDMFEECKNTILRRYDSTKESVKALADLSSPQLKRKAFLFAADMALASGDVDEDEDEMLEAMQRVLDIDDATASKIVEVLTYKYEK